MFHVLEASFFAWAALGRGDEVEMVVVVVAAAIRFPNTGVDTSFTLDCLLDGLELELGDDRIKLLIGAVGSDGEVGDSVVADNLVAGFSKGQAPNGGPRLAVVVSVDLGNCWAKASKPGLTGIFVRIAVTHPRCITMNEKVGVGKNICDWNGHFKDVTITL